GLGAPGLRRVGRRNGVLTLRLLSARYRGSSLLKYGLAYVKFAWRAYSVLRRLHAHHRLDAVQTNNLPNLVGLLALPLRRWKVRCVHDVHDPEPELFLSKFGTGVPARLGFVCAKLIERWVARVNSVLIWAVAPS